jgi:methylmalonyl-CoA mutase
MSSKLPDTETRVSLDKVFASVTRQQWAELAVAGLDASANAGALQQLRRTTLEGIALDVLCDTAEISVVIPPIPNNEAVSGARMDNRFSVALTNVSNSSERILQALQGGIGSIEIHTQSNSELATTLEQVQLDIAPVSLRAGLHYANCANTLFDVAGRQKIAKMQLSGSLNADPLGHALNTSDASQLKAALPEQLKSMAQFAKNTLSNAPLMRSVLVDATTHHNAGASTVEELHAVLATATLYLEALLAAGMNTSDAAQCITFQIAMDADVLLGVAKLRSLRTLWNHTLQQFDPQADNTLYIPATIVAETSRRYTSTLDPWNNHLRNITASTAAFLGNANTLIVHPHDNLLRVNEHYDTVRGDRIARNIAIILERECSLAKVHDPMAGSYAIENLTQKLMQHTWESLASTDTAEGWLDELQSGRWQTRLAHTHRQRIQLMEEEKRVSVGVNRFVPATQDSDITAVIPPDTPSALQAVREAAVFESHARQKATS